MNFSAQTKSIFKEPVGPTAAATLFLITLFKVKRRRSKRKLASIFLFLLRNFWVSFAALPQRSAASLSTYTDNTVQLLSQSSYMCHVVNSHLSSGEIIARAFMALYKLTGLIYFRGWGCRWKTSVMNNSGKKRASVQEKEISDSCISEWAKLMTHSHLNTKIAPTVTAAQTHRL